MANRLAALLKQAAQTIDDLLKQNQQLRYEIARLKQELELLQKLGRQSSPPF